MADIPTLDVKQLDRIRLRPTWHENAGWTQLSIYDNPYCVPFSEAPPMARLGWHLKRLIGKAMWR